VNTAKISKIGASTS